MSAQVIPTAKKIKDLSDLARDLESARAGGKKVVHCHGVFDLLHIGHIRHFQQAKSFGDILVVTLTEDQHVNKGPSRPVFDQVLRAEAIAALDCVDYVAINKWPLAAEAIRLIRPDLYVKGSDYKDANDDQTGGIVIEGEAIRSVGGELVFTNDITFSASSLINQNLSVFPKGVTDYLSGYSSRYSSQETIGYLDRANNLKVLVIGETIIDEYLYCEPLGKTGKQPVLAAQYLSSDKFAGGIVAVANHVSGFCDNTKMLTTLGTANSQEEFIRAHVRNGIDSVYFYQAGNVPTIVKRRFIAAYPFQTLFEIYEMNDEGFDKDETASFCGRLEEMLPDCDVVIVTDYGHGMLGPDVVELLCDKAPFLAINTQVNAGNRGFNTVSKYRRADFICVSENEIRLEARSRDKDLRQIITEVGARLSCPNIVITQGQHGSLCFGKDEGFFEIPALATRVVDRIGAGDAVFSVSALCAAQQAPIEIVGLIGNAAGAEAVATIGHTTSVERVGLSRHIEALLK